MLKRVGKLYEGLGDFALAPAVEQKRTPALRAGSASGRSTLVAPDSKPRPPWMAIEWPDFLFKMH